MLGYRDNWKGFLAELMAEHRANAAAAIGKGYMAESRVVELLQEDLVWIRDTIKKDRSALRTLVKDAAREDSYGEHGGFFNRKLARAHEELAASVAFRDELVEGIREQKRLERATLREVDRILADWRREKAAEEGR